MRTFLSVIGLTLFTSMTALPAMAGTTPAATTKAKDESLTLKLSNLTDATADADVKKLEGAVKKVAGVNKASVNKKQGEVIIAFKAGSDTAAIKKAVTDAGFTIVE